MTLIYVRIEYVIVNELTTFITFYFVFCIYYPVKHTPCGKTTGIITVVPFWRMFYTAVNIKPVKYLSCKTFLRGPHTPHKKVCTISAFIVYENPPYQKTGQGWACHEVTFLNIMCCALLQNTHVYVECIG